MGMLDAFAQDDRITLKVNDLIHYFRNEARTNAQNEVLLNGVRAHLPYSHILTMIGEKDPIGGEREDGVKEG